MTTSARAKRGLYPENPPTNEPCAKQSKNGRLVIPAIQSARTNMPLWKAVAFAGVESCRFCWRARPRSVLRSAACRAVQRRRYCAGAL